MLDLLIGDWIDMKTSGDGKQEKIKRKTTYSPIPRIEIKCFLSIPELYPPSQVGNGYA